MLENTFGVDRDEIRDLHNGKCELYYLQQIIQDNYKDTSPMVTKINRAMKLLVPVIERLMEERDREIDEIQKQADLISKGRSFKSVWSIYDNKPFDQSWRGKTLTYNGISTIIPADREVNMETLYPLCDSLIKESDDDFHIFIEGFYEKDGKIVMFTGS